MAFVKEIKYYGIHACLMLFQNRPESIIRVYLEEAHLKTFRSLLQWCAKQRIVYRIVPSLELDKISGSVHHEGVCILAEETPFSTEKDFFSSLKNLPPACCLLYLDGVENPHNLGSILRTAAHFGIPYILGCHLPALSPSCCRIAKGAAEVVQLVDVKNPKKLFSALGKEGFELFATSSHKGQALHQISFPRRSILAIGAESSGLSPDLLKSAARSIRIPGTGVMESLNVSVATGLCMGLYSFQHGQFR